MLLNLVIWTLALAIFPLVLGILECWMLGGFAPTRGEPAEGFEFTPSPRRGLTTITLPFASGPATVSPAQGLLCPYLYCSPTGPAEVVYAGVAEAAPVVVARHSAGRHGEPAAMTSICSASGGAVDQTSTAGCAGRENPLHREVSGQFDPLEGPGTPRLRDAAERKGRHRRGCSPAPSGRRGHELVIG